MKYVAVICEYNPFHNGHRYQLERAVRNTAADGVIALMSGPFVQRAEPAVADPFTRAECALRYGADMVIELPVAVATAAGRDFARGGVRLAAQLPDVQYLAMGCEDEEYVRPLAEVQAEETDTFKAALKSALDAGAAFAAAYTAATATEAERRGIDRTTAESVLKKPNNLLCIEYIKALKELDCGIEPLLIKRKGNGYNDLTIGPEFASASAIRARMQDDPDSVRLHMPDTAGQIILEHTHAFPVREEIYESLVIDAIRRADTAYLKTLRSVGEGIENKLKDAAAAAATLPDLLNDVKTKRYTMSRVKRIALEALLGLTKNAPLPPARILGVREDFKPYLSRLGDNFYVSPARMGGLTTEQRASDVYSLITRRPGNAFYSTRLVVL